MPKFRLTPRLLVVLAIAVLASALSATPALAAPEEGDGTLSASSPLVLGPTTAGAQSSLQNFSFEYQGSGEVNVQKVSIEGAEAGEFSLGGTSCNGLAAGQKCDAWIAFKPASPGIKQAELRFGFVGLHPEESFAISAEAVPAEISLDPVAYDYGLRRVNHDSVSSVFQLTNDGAAEVQLGNIEIGGDSSVFWTGASNCWSTWLAPGQSCSIEVYFGPHETRTYAAELRVSAYGTTATAALSGEGGRAVVEPPAAPVDFGFATVGSAGAVRTITLQNTGNLAEAFFIGIVAGGDSGSFRLLDENCSGHELAPLGTCSASVRFEPLGAGQKAGHLAFFGDGEGGVLIELEGEGVAPAAQLTPASLDFGSLTLGARSPAREVVVGNYGSTAVQLDRVALAGSDVGAFSVVGDNCTGTTLEPGGRCVVRVRFTPDEPRAFAATLRIGGPAGTLAATLSGSGAAEGIAPASVAKLDAESATAAGSRAATKKPHRHRRFARNATIVAPAARSSRLRR